MDDQQFTYSFVVFDVLLACLVEHVARMYATVTSLCVCVRACASEVVGGWVMSRSKDSDGRKARAERKFPIRNKSTFGV